MMLVMANAAEPIALATAELGPELVDTLVAELARAHTCCEHPLQPQQHRHRYRVVEAGGGLQLLVGEQPNGGMWRAQRLADEAVALVWLWNRNKPAAGELLTAIEPLLQASDPELDNWPPGSLGEALREQAFCGQRVEHTFGTLEITDTAVRTIRHPQKRRACGWLAIALKLTTADTCLEFVLHTHELDCWSLRAPAEYAARTGWGRALQQLLGQLAEELRLLSSEQTTVVSHLLDALMPPVFPGTLAAWFAGALPEDSQLVARAQHGQQIVELELHAGTVEQNFLRFGVVSAAMRVVVRKLDQTIENLFERRVWLGALDPATWAQSLDAPALQQVGRAFEIWQTAAQQRLKKLLIHSSEVQTWWQGSLPGCALAKMCVTWAAEGPPGPRPMPIDLAAALARSRGKLHRVDEDGMAHLRSRIEHHAVLAYKIGVWTIILGPYLPRLNPGVFFEDQILVMRDGEPPVVVLMSDPWNAPICFTVDGDAHLYRAFAVWLATALRQHGLDTVLKFIDEDEADEDELPSRIELPVSRWLMFGDRWREDVEHDELIDWRLQRDIVVGGQPFWRCGIYGHSDEQQQAFARGVATWHQFVREVLDPNFKLVVHTNE